MAVPILRQGGVLVASVPTSTTDDDLIDLQGRLVEQVGAGGVFGAVIDVTEVDVLDSFATRVLRNTALMVQLRGAEVIVVGIQPAVALAMIELGLALEGVRTAFALEEGLAFLGVDLGSLG